MRARFKHLGRAAVCAIVLLLAPSAGQAAILAPGDTAMPDLLTDAVLFSSVVAFVDEVPFSNLLYSGNLSAAVVETASGTLDFYYQITNNPTSSSTLRRNTEAVFTQGSTVFLTDVYYRDDPSGLGSLFTAGDAGATPLSADRSLFDGGEVVGFNFGLATPGINPGETSRILVIRTNAVAFTTGFSALINGITTNVDTFAPAAAPVPEPASLLLLSSAFAAAGYMARHRAKRRKPTSA